MAQPKKSDITPVRPARTPKVERKMCKCKICGKPYSFARNRVVCSDSSEEKYIKSGLCRACFDGKTALPKGLQHTVSMSDSEFDI